MASIKRWEGGPLRVRLPGPLPHYIDAAVYEPLRPGWAVRADRPFVVETACPGIQLEFDLRNGQLECVAIRSNGGPEITSTLLRTVEPMIAPLARETYAYAIARLVELEDGSIVGEFPFAIMPGNIGVEYGVPSPDVLSEFPSRSTQAGRPSLPATQLQRVAELYREADLLRQPHGKHIAREFPNFSQPTIRNWIRLARERGFLGPAPGPRRSGEQPKGETDG